MRSVPLIFLAILLVGCGAGREDAASVAASAPMAEAKSAFRSDAAADVAFAGEAVNGAPMGGAGFVGGRGAARAQGRTAAYEAPAPVARLIVRNGDLSLRVKDIEKAEREVRSVARGMGGTVEASQGTDLAGPSPSLSITLRVPEPRFDATLVSLEGLGTRLGKTISSEDVTAQAVDMDARVKSLRVQEDAYRAILAAARRISDVLEVQERLTGVRTEIEQIVAGRRGLGDQAARSKVTVTLTQAALPPSAASVVEPDWLAQTWGEATGSLKSVGRGVASFGIWTLTMTPVWVPLALVAAFAARRLRKAAL